MRRLNYGWLVVAAVFLSTGLTIGTSQYAFGVFISPLEREFGWTRTQINAFLSVAALSALFGAVTGRIMDRVGARRVIAVSLVLLGLSYALRLVMTELWHFYALGVLLAVAFSGTTLLPTGKLVGLWFQKTRGRMMGIATMGNNFGGLTITPLAALILAAAGWRWGYGVFAILILAAVPLVYLVVRDKPEDVAQAAGPSPGREHTRQPSLVPADDPPRADLAVSEALKTRAFYAVTIGIMCANFAYAGILTQLIPHLENEGVPLVKASLAQSLMAASGMGGKLVFGLMAERIPARFALMLSLGIQIVGLVMLITWANTPLLWVVMPFFGIAFGAVGALNPLLVQETFGVRHFGTFLGITNIATIVPMVAGPLMVGALYDATGAYRLAFLLIAGIFVVGILVLPLAAAPRRLLAGRQPSQ